MSEEKKALDRRGFLKGAAAAGVAAAVSGSGLLVNKLGAQDQLRMLFTRSDIKEPANVMEDRDVLPLAEDLAKASFEAAYDAFNAAAEDIVKGKYKQVNTEKILAKHGLKLYSKEAKATAVDHQIPASILQNREELMKQKLCHSHAKICGELGRLSGCLHWHGLC